MNPTIAGIDELCIELRLNGFLEGYQAIADECAREQISYCGYLRKLLQFEQKMRTELASATILKAAKFPKIKPLESFDFASSNVNKIQVQELATLRFIENQENVLLLGPSGVGKTHLACSLGYIAAWRRIKVKFITAADLILQLEVAQSQGKLAYYLKKVIGGTQLLIIDELGYIKFNAQQANLFFQIINKRYETGSIIITSNLSFLKWQEVLNNDEALTTAILDRLIHHSHILSINGDSYRLKQKKEAGVLPFNNKLKPGALNQS